MEKWCVETLGPLASYSMGTGILVSKTPESEVTHWLTNI